MPGHLAFRPYWLHNWRVRSRLHFLDRERVDDINRSIYPAVLNWEFDQVNEIKYARTEKLSTLVVHDTLTVGYYA